MVLRISLPLVGLLVCAEGFAFLPQRRTQTASTSLYMGLFDGVKEAFTAAPLEKSELAPDRETPIDRWMGWSVTSQNEKQAVAKVDADFVDAMDESNYLAVALSKPMGIVFEENDAEFGGIFVQSIKEEGVAATDGTIKVGDQLIAVSTKSVSGLPFEDALNTIVDSEGDKVKLVLFRGSAKQFYGPTGASKAWLEEFVAKGGIEVSAAS